MQDYRPVLKKYLLLLVLFAGTFSAVPAMAAGETEQSTANPHAVTAGMYRAELQNERLRLLWKDEILVDDFMPLLVAEGWSKTYANEGYLPALTADECTFAGDTLTVERDRGECEFKLTIRVDAEEGFEITVNYHTPHPEKLEFEQLFLLLPQECFAQTLYDYGSGLRQLPPRLGFDPNRNSRERMTPDAESFRVFRNFGVVEFTGVNAPLFLYDARYHIWKGNSQRTFAIILNNIPDSVDTKLQLRVRERAVPAPDSAALVQLEPYTSLTEVLPLHVVLDDRRSLDLRAGKNTFHLTPAPADDECAAVAIFTPAEPEQPRLQPTTADSSDEAVFELPEDATAIAFGVVRRGTDEVLSMSEPAPVLADAPARKALELLEKLDAMNSEKLGRTRDRIEALGKEANSKQDRAGFEQLCAELGQIDKLVVKLDILNRCGVLAEALKDDYFLYLTPSTRKIYNRARLPEELNPAAPFELSGARNEFLNFQLTASTLFGALKNAQVKNFTLRNAEGKSIPTEAVIYSIEDIVSGADIVPDLLSKNTRLDITPTDDSRSWWINFKIPPDLAPGNYTVCVEFAADGKEPRSIDANLHVFNFTLPDKFDAVAIVGVFTQELRALPDYRPEMEEEIQQFLIDRGFYASPGLSHPRYMDDFDYRLNRFYRQQIEKFNYLTLAGIPYVEWLEKFYTDGKLPSGDAYREMVVETMLANAAQLKKEGLLSSVYAYYDEVEKNDQRVLDFIRSVRDKSGVKFAVAFHKAGFGTDYVDFYADDVDLFYFSSAFLEQERWLEYMKQLKARGKKIGVYFNIVYPPQPSCNVIDAPALAHRTLFWTQWKYDIDYNLFWGINCWWANLNLNTDPQSVNNRGDGILLYRDIRGGGYAPSLRLEIMREGVQDYLYLRLLKACIEQMKTRPGAAEEHAAALREAEELLAVNWLENAQCVPLDENILLGQRAACARLIEYFRNISTP